MKLAPSRTFRIGVDLMGSDHPPAVLLEALNGVPAQEGVELIAIGSPDLMRSSPFEFHVAADCISMHDNPVTAIRKKRDASVLVGLRLLKQGKIDALVSAGNTGSLVLGSKIILSNLGKILRPAFLSFMPTKKRPVAVLDLGANVQCKAIHLVQFALLASAYLRTMGIENPKIGLLNIGEEPLKGTSELRLAYHQLQTLTKAPFKFVGNIEGKSVFDGEVEALITDGFTGNVFLKTAEGIASLILDRINGNLPKDTLQTLKPQLSDLEKHLHYAEYPGALLLGVRGIVIKCHGYSTPKAFTRGIQGAITLVKESFMEKFRAHIKNYIP